MGRSHGFASTTTNYGALFRLAFATDPHLKCLTLLVKVTRRLIMQKARRHPLRAHEEINENQLRALGFALAKMHELSKSFNTHKENDRNLSWMKKTYQSISDCLNHSVKNLISEELIYLQDLPSDLPKGIIHADLFRDNVLFEDDTIGGIIDFYYACTDYFIYDIAIVINDWCQSWRCPLFADSLTVHLIIIIVWVRATISFAKNVLNDIGDSDAKLIVLVTTNSKCILDLHNCL